MLIYNETTLSILTFLKWKTSLISASLSTIGIVKFSVVFLKSRFILSDMLNINTTSVCCDPSDGG